MRARTSISPDVLLDVARMRESEVDQLHLELTGMLAAHGLVYWGSDDDKDLFLASVAALGAAYPDAGKAWEVLLASHRDTTISPPVPEMLGNGGTAAFLRHLQAERISALIVDEDHADSLGCTDRDLSFVDPSTAVEVLRPRALYHSHTFGPLRRRQQTSAVCPNTDREHVYETRCLPLVDSCATVTVFDAYIGKGLCENQMAPMPAPAYLNPGASELEWFLAHVDADSEQVTVDVFTAFDSGDGSLGVSEQDIVAALHNLAAQLRLGRGGIRSLRAFLVPRKGRSWIFPHDRHLRFDVDGFELSAGFDRFRFERVSDWFSMRYAWLPDDLAKLRGEEQLVRNTQGSPPHTIV